MKRTTNPAATRRPAARLWGGPSRAWQTPSRYGWLWGWLLGLASGLGPPLLACASGPAAAGDVFVKAVASSPRVYVGQAFTVSYLLYHRVSIIEPDEEITLKFANCLVEEYPPSPHKSTETIGGRVYKVLLLKKYLLVPQLAGSLQLPVLARRYSISTPPGPNDFFGEQQLVSKTIRSPAGQLLVEALPAPPDSLAFCHAVGQFQFQPTYTVSPKADNMLTVRLQLSGTGSLKNFKLPVPPLPAGMDLFNVRDKTHHTLAAQGWQAIGTYSYEVLATYRGTYALPGIAFTYFDPARGRYVPFVAPAFRWRVAQGASAPPLAAAPRRVVAARGAALYTKSTLFQDRDKYLFLGSPACYLLLLAAGALFLAGIAYTYHVEVRTANSQHIQFKRAHRRAIRAIRKAEQLPTAATDEYHKTLADILVTYMANKLGPPAPDFCGHRLPAVLRACEVPPALQGRTVAYLGRLHKLRFAANGAALSRRTYSEELRAIIHQLDACLHEQPYSQLVDAAK